MADSDDKIGKPASGRSRRFVAWAWGLATGTAGIAFVLGILFWGGFNTAMEWTNREAFCISCQEIACVPVTTPTSTLLDARIGPCSMWHSR